ncbi:peptidase M23 [Pseudomethylobacillus aquaticus]|uniref:Peptidase M23 n=1 Tax=Pseudomethylobacillus aquaticus TaxID=2676064 RepID=A0A3N0V399_9PROT|nr:peptidoglycan DD-metalloendopeptidase family protein [Pseudomethylobacillus aquaticus]ROH87203.1 peptidase M23 [Pseudomethylobacillus aquaticus]
MRLDRHAPSPLRAALLPALLLAAILCSEAQADPKTERPKQELSELQARIAALREELDESKEAHKDASDALKESEQAISLANRKLYEIQQNSQQQRAMLGKLKLDRSSVEKQVQRQQRLLGLQLYRQYVQGQPNHAQILLQQQDISVIARDLHYASLAARARADLISAMRNNLDTLDQLNAEAAAAAAEIAALQEAKERERQALQQQKRERSKVLASIAGQMQAQRGEIDKLKRDQSRLTKLIEKLARAAAPKPAKRQSQNTSTGGTKPTTIARNEALPSSRYDGSQFSSLRGKLNLPVRGEVSNRFGAARADSGVSWKGIFIRSAEGSEVKAVAKGQVVFADWLRGFGNLLIVDHGDGYMSLYGNNQSLLRQVGDEVKGGDTVAAVGNSGGNESNGLYYELRHRSQPLDPMSWSSVR